MAFNDGTNLYNTSRFIVDQNGGTPYTTIQAALDAAQAEGNDATVFVKQGTYNENLTLYPQIDIQGSDHRDVNLSGSHTPPTAGSFTISDVDFIASGTGVFSSAASGNATLSIRNCLITITTGYTFNLINWRGVIIAENIRTDISGDSFINNANDATVLIKNSQIGRTSGPSFIMDGTLTLDNVEINVPISLSGTRTSTISNSIIKNTITTSATANLEIYNTTFLTGANQAITHNSSGNIILSETTIETSNNPAIGGTGPIQIGSITFLDNSIISAGAIDYATNLNVGTINASTDENIVVKGAVRTPQLNVYCDDSTTNSNIVCRATGNISREPPEVVFARQRGTLATPVQINNGDVLGALLFAGYNTADFEIGAELRAVVDGTPGTNDMPARWEFYNSVDGTSSPVLTYTIDNAGDATYAKTGALKVHAGTTAQRPASPVNGMIRYNSTIAALEAYENGAWVTFATGFVTGSWTPVLSFGGGSVGITYALQFGNYTRIGDMVHFSGFVRLTSKGTSVGNAIIGGLPFTCANGAVASSYWTNINLGVNYTYIAPFVNGSSTNILLIQNGDNVADLQLTNTEFANNTRIDITGTYKIT